ncbi:MAG TPA: MarC family protein [Gammaproteobacteria bacterium]|nr:MarC family protein [Gammaproteobacteria bacterium]
MNPGQLVNIFVVLFVVIDPLGTASIFAVLTRGMTVQQRRGVALRGVLIAAFILVVFGLIGRTLLQLLGIGMPAFRLAGGILLFMLAIDMVLARQSGLRGATPAERSEAIRRDDISVFPLAFPLLAGPGALTILLILMGSGPPGIRFALILGLLLLVLALTLAALILAPRLMRLLGETGTNVVDRLLGVILAALAMQFVIDGLRAVLAG